MSNNMILKMNTVCEGLESYLEKMEAQIATLPEERAEKLEALIVNEMAKELPMLISRVIERYKDADLSGIQILEE